MSGDRGEEAELVERVRAKAERMAAARREGRGGLLDNLAHVAGLGWTFVLPLLLGVLLGRLLARATGRPLLVLPGIGLGLLAAGWAAWVQIRRGLASGGGTP